MIRLAVNFCFCLLVAAFACYGSAQTAGLDSIQPAFAAGRALYFLLGLVAFALLMPQNGVHALGKYAQFYRASAERNFRRGPALGHD